ncbi:Nitroreductase [Pseudarcicella hirudinis]|uniref:Nitroreductase n=1 Tax=Pseudarcicella hirudinis TaxID=1079859 RepID=A0A1I5RKS7_9BACT|nr:NAD(P)H-dependent oxidoreductase [Pseudarcicella hirudinis]SFP58526.1 Nitroreductase [Pseudarcicella hirudinis]
MELLEKLNWRYAAKRMNGNKVSEEKLNRILEAIQLTPSSLGLQPYTVLVIEDQALRQQIQPLAYNQPQITEASHLLVFAAWEAITDQNVADYLNNIAETRGIALESLNPFKAAIDGALIAKKDDMLNWNARQAYIALGTATVAAAVENVDATPMEGFDPKGLDELLGLREKGLRSIAILPLGYRDAANDYLASAKKVRRNKEQLFVNI